MLHYDMVIYLLRVKSCKSCLRDVLVIMPGIKSDPYVILVLQIEIHQKLRVILYG